MNVYINVRGVVLGCIIASVVCIVMLHAGISIHSFTSSIFRKQVRL